MYKNATPLRAVLSAFALACALLQPGAHALSARQAGRTRDATAEPPEDKTKLLPLYEKSYALVIGASAYDGAWPKLNGVKKDVEAVAAALERQGFLVTVVMNPDAALLEKSFKDFRDKYGSRPEHINNRLLFYFAGHGQTLRQSYGGDEMGYIVPVGAPAASAPDFRSKAISMRWFELYAEELQAKHALFVFDSCFSGSIFTRKSKAAPEPINSKTSLPVRQFLTSGSADEKVPDDRVFRSQFVDGIGGAADLNPTDGYVTASELAEFVYDRVVKFSRPTQHPQFGTIRGCVAKIIFKRGSALSAFR